MPERIQKEEVAPRVRHDEVVERDPLAQPREVQAYLVGSPFTAIKFRIVAHFYEVSQCLWDSGAGLWQVPT